MGAIEKKFPWQKKIVPQLIALEPRMLFDGAAAVVATADTDPNASQTTDTNTTSTVNDPAIQNAQTEQTEGSAEVQALDSTANISSTEQLNEFVGLLPGAKISLQLVPGNYATTEALTQAQQEAERLVSEILGRADARQQLFTLFNGGQTEHTPSSEWNTAYQTLIDNLNNGSANPIRLEIRSAEELERAKAAFTISGTSGEPTIYLNGDWLSGYEDVGVAGADPASISKVLVEEIGHYLDATLNNGADTFGDEGEMFSRYLVDGANPLTVSLTATPEDHATLLIDGQSVQAELASFNFVNAYEMLRDLDGDGVVDNNEYWAAKEQETHTIIFGKGSDTSGLGQTKFTDGTNNKFFSGNDVSGAVSLVIGGQTYYGWISRPVKVGGVVKAFYFWTDSDFNNKGSSAANLAAAQADGNQDGDGNVADNRGFVLVVDQSYFNGLTKTSVTVPPTNGAYSSLEAGTYTTSVVKSSSDRVDASINDLIKTNIDPTANPDLATGTPSITASTREGNAALEQGHNVPMIPGSGNVLSNDTDTISGFKEVTSIISDLTGNSTTASSSGVTLVGKYGSLTIKSDGSWTYTPYDNNPTVDALKGGSFLQETFTYTVSDGMGGADQGLLTVQINGSNDAPIAINDYNTAKEHTSSPSSGYNAKGNVLPNDTDVDNGDGKSLFGFVLNGSSSVGSVANSAGTYSLTLNGSPSTKTGEWAFVYTGTGTPANGSVYVGLYTYDASGTHNYKIVTYKVSGSGTSAIVTFSALPTFYYDPSTNAYVSITDFVGFFSAYKNLIGKTPVTGAGADTNNTGETDTRASNSNLVTITGASITTAGYATLSGFAGTSGTIAVGMSVSGPGVISGTTVSSITYNTDGTIGSIKLSNEVTSPQSGTFTFTKSVSLTNNVTVDGAHGTLTLNYGGVQGAYLYTPKKDDPGLNTGQSALEVFDYSMQDSAGVTSSAKLFITVYGSDTSDPVLMDDTEINAYEAGVGRDPSSPATLTNDNTAFAGEYANATGNVLTNDTEAGTSPSVVSFSTEDGSKTETAGQTLTGLYGSLTISAAGAFSYVINNDNSTVKALLPTDTLTETFIYKVTNGAGGISYARLVITIKGTNDVPVASNDTAGTLTEDIDLGKSGSVLGNDSDVDANDTKTVIHAGTNTANLNVTAGTTSSDGRVVDGTYGRLVIGADGAYTYTLGYTADQKTALQDLTTADSRSEIFTYEVADSYSATSTATLTFAIQGTNEPPVNKVNDNSFSDTTTTSFTTAQDSPLIFTGTKLLTVTDSEADLNYVTLTVESGILSLTNTSNYTSATSGYATVTGLGTTTLMITGSQEKINAALALLKYTPSTGFTGADYLTISSRDATNLWDSDGISIIVATSIDESPLPLAGSDGVYSVTLDMSKAFTNNGTSVSYSVRLLDGASVGSGFYALVPADTVTSDGDGVGQGSEIMLVDNGNGTVKGVANGTTEVFVLSVDGSGVVTLAYSNPADPFNIWHSNNSDGDDYASLRTATAGKLLLTKTADGVSASVDLASPSENPYFLIEDDAPKITAGSVAAIDQLTVDESALANNASADFANNFTSAISYGTDGAGSTAYTVVLTGSNVASGLYALGEPGVRGDQILLNQSGNTITGSAGGADYFTISIDHATGAVTLDQLAAIYHSDSPSNDDTSTLTTAAGVLVLRATVTDADGDAVTHDLDVGAGSAFNFKDDGPSVTVSATDSTSVVIKTHDDHLLPSGDLAVSAANFDGIFSAVAIYGADGQASSNPLVWTYSLNATDGVDSGLRSGSAIYLYMVGNDVIGSTQSVSRSDETGDVFRISVSATGVVTLTQYKQVDHAGGATEVLLANSMVTLTGNATVTDKDGDTTSGIAKTVDLGGNLGFINSGAAPLTVNDISVNEDSPYAVFTVSGAVGQLASLALTNGTTTGLSGMQYFDGTNWKSYTSGTVALDGSGKLLVRTSLTPEQEDPIDNGETFTLTATNTGGTAAVGTATIHDDGSGDVFKDDGTADGTAVKDDDRTISVTAARPVNESSTFAMFTVTAIAGYELDLALQNASSGTAATWSGFTLLDFSTDGTTWTTYDAIHKPFVPAGGKVYVRVNITSESDAPYEGPETFALKASYTTNTSKSAAADSTIIDDGTGTKYDGTITIGSPTGSATSLDDDRGITVTGLDDVSEGSNAIFTVTLTGNPSGTDVTLSLGAPGDTAGSDDYSALTGATAYYYVGGTKTALTITDGKVTLPSGYTTFYVSVPTTTDSRYEGAENFTLTASANSKSGSDTTTILDDGSGKVYDDKGVATGGTPDDDRTVTVSSPSVNEKSDWVVFTVTGTAGDSLSLALVEGSGTGFANINESQTLQVWNGSTWTNYSSSVSVPADGTLLVRVDIKAEQDAPYEGPETFQLQVTPAGRTAVTGTATIVDDGTSVIYTDVPPVNGLPVTSSTGLDDDRPLLVTAFGPVNEASTYAMFEVQATPGQSLKLQLGNTTSLLDVDATIKGFKLEWSSDGNTWTQSNDVNSVPATGIVFVRTVITPEADTPYEGPETFTLTASYTSEPSRSASGIATIIDNGTGSLYDGTFSNGSPIKPSGNLDDDRSALSIPDVNVNENSPYVVFQVSAQGGQQFSLALSDGAPGFDQTNNTGTIDKQQAVKPNGTDTAGDYRDQIQVYNGTTWASYVPGALVTVPPSGSVLLVRVPLVDDALYEGSHAFTLIATPTNAGSPASGRAIIGDFGTGSIFNDSGAEDRKAPKDDDRVLRVDSPIVNEGSEHVVFTVTGITGGPIQLQLQDTTGGTGFATLPNPTLEYWSGSAWLPYTGVGLNPGTDFPSGGTLSVRVAIGDEQDAIREGSERFSLVVSGIGGPSTGVATIRDDGTGLFWLDDNLSPATASQLTSAGKILDDDFDLDGITPTTEEALATLAASQGFGSAPGDLNGDGIADALQNALATLAWQDVASFDAGNEGTLTDVKPVISLKALDDASGNSVSSTMQLQNIRVLDYNSSDEFGAAANAVSKDASTGQRTVTLVSGVAVNTPYDPIRFELTTQEGVSNLTDIFGNRDGLQVRMVIDMRAAQLDANEFNSYIKFVSQQAIDAAGATPLKDLQGNAITKEGWYDFTQRTANGDGARFIIEAGKIVAVELILTDNAFGDNNLRANQIFDPGVLVKASVPQPEAETVDPVQSEEFIRPAIPQFTQFNANEKHGFSDEESFDSEFDFAIPKYELQGEWAMKAQFTKASLANTTLKGADPEHVTSPKAPVNEPPGRPPVGEGSLRNTLTPPDVMAGAGGVISYLLPEGTFMGGQGLVRLQATLKDGSPLPAWITFDGATGKFNAQVPNNLVKPIEIKVEARDSKGGKAETVFKIQPRSDKLGFVGKQSLTTQIQNAIRLRA